MGNPREHDNTASTLQQHQPSLTFIVDKGGSGRLTTVQEAINAVPDNSPTRTLVIIKPGTYKEKVVVKESKVNLTLQGEDYRNTSIVWDDNSQRAKGTGKCASVAVHANNFVASNLSFHNTAPPPSQVGVEGGQAVALLIDGDQGAFYNCGFYSFQDTLYDKKGRHFFRDCFIQGTVDFICGDGRSLYQGCQLNSNIAEDKGKVGPGAITAQKRESLNEVTGFSFVNCTITGSGTMSLGRAWGPFSSVIFAKTCICAAITSDRWANIQNDYSRTVLYREYYCIGPGASSDSGGMFWKRPTDSEAAQLMDISYIDGSTWALPPRVGHIDISPCGSSSGMECKCGTDVEPKLVNN